VWYDLVAKRQGKEERSSFLKKRSKKLLRLASGALFKTSARTRPLKSKSFLVLFFKKNQQMRSGAGWCCMHRRKQTMIRQKFKGLARSFWMIAAGASLAGSLLIAGAASAQQ